MGKNQSTITVKWLDEPQEHDYPAAASFLSLMRPPNTVEGLVRQLKAAPKATFLAKDIFRASGVSQLGVSNSHVERDRQKITAGKALSPILLVRDPDRGRVIIADGYHRMCAVYSVDEDAAIPCKIV